ncbi:MAG: SDR family oxidoreductase [Gemmatimonas sp.]|nr:SDR family oxidoreductase [Gemmatimonas sp.]
MVDLLHVQVVCPPACHAVAATLTMPPTSLDKPNPFSRMDFDMPNSDELIGSGPEGVGRESPPRVPSIPSPTVDVHDAVELLLEQVVEDPQAAPALAGRGMRGRCAIVTGGARGIGRAIALELAGLGCHIAFNYFDGEGSGTLDEEAKRTAREITQLEVRVHWEVCDVRDPDAVRDFVDRSEKALGGLQILVNNAGISRDRALWRLTDDQWNTVLETNLTGAFNLIRAVAPRFRAQGDGKIVNVSSIHAFQSEFGLANYSASKAGLLALTRAAALELGPSNINVNAVAPGFIRTMGLTDRVPPEILDRAREKSALGRLGDPRDVAQVVVFLCSEMARHITGAVVPVDGGHRL